LFLKLADFTTPVSPFCTPFAAIKVTDHAFFGQISASLPNLSYPRNRV